MKAEKAAKYKELKDSKNKKLFDEWFLSYKPDLKQNQQTIKNKKTIKKNKKTSKTKKRWNF